MYIFIVFAFHPCSSITSCTSFIMFYSLFASNIFFLPIDFKQSSLCFIDFPIIVEMVLQVGYVMLWYIVLQANSY